MAKTVKKAGDGDTGDNAQTPATTGAGTSDRAGTAVAANRDLITADALRGTSAASGAERRPEPNQVEASMTLFLNGVVEKISGELDTSKIRVSYDPTATPPVMRLAHDFHWKGQDHELRYEVRFEGDRVIPPSRIDTEQPVVITVPPGTPTAEVLRQMKDAYRQATIHDPLLNPRFTRKEIELEEFQVAAVEALNGDLALKKMALLVLGTGGGKTRIAETVIRDQLQQLREQAPDDGRPVVAMFIVNNNIILAEARGKLETRFTYITAGSIHGGRKETDGDVLYTTPGSLLGDSKEGRLDPECTLAELLADKRIGLIVFDETHHLPASQPRLIYDLVRQAAEERGDETRVLGMTATETRPDMQDVLSFFGGAPSYECTAAELTDMGYLCKFRYHAHDSWLHPKDQTPAVILPGDDISPEIKARLYSSEAFPHIADAIEQSTAGSLDKRTLVVAPGTALAGELVEHLNRDERFAGQVVRLTAADREADPTLFAQTYQAWKEGVWPPGSPKAGQPGPDVVVAVDLFKEGTDAPGIRALVNWADTNSLISFLQTLGRGLRPDVMKTELVVADIAGTFRKAHLLEWLGDRAEGRDRKEGNGGGGGGGGERTPGTPSAEVLDQIFQNPEVSAQVAAVLADVPARIARRYPGADYSNIPVEEIEKLHECLSKRADCATGASFDAMLTEFGRELAEGAPVGRVQEMRRALVPVFFRDRGDAEVAQNEDIPRDRATMLIHAHLAQRMATLNPDLTSEAVARVFPEFSKQSIDMYATVGANLQMLRRQHFQMRAPDMGKELAKTVVNAGRLDHNMGARQVLWDLGIHESDDEAAFAIAENRNVNQDSMRSKYQQSSEQDSLVAAYLEHPDIKDKLTAADFRLPRDQFEQRLAEEGLIKLDPAERRSFFSALDRQMRALERAIERDDGGAIAGTAAAVKQLLDSPTLHEYLESNPPGRERITKLDTFREKFAQYKGDRPEVGEVLTSLATVRDIAMQRREYVLQEEPLHKVTVERDPNGNKFVATFRHPHIPGESGTGSIHVEPIEWLIKRDLPRTHVLVPSKQMIDLDRYGDAVPAEVREKLLDVMTETTRRVVAHAGLRADTRTEGENDSLARPVVILPSRVREAGEAQPVTTGLLAYLKDRTDLDILVGGPFLPPNTSSDFNLHMTPADVAASRVSGLTPEFVASFDHYEQRTATRRNYAADLKVAYRDAMRVRGTVLAHRGEWDEMLATAVGDPEKMQYARAVIGALEQIDNYRHMGSEYRARADKLYRGLEAARVDGQGLTVERLVLLAAQHEHGNFNFRGFDQKTSALNEIQGSLPRLFSTIEKVLDRGIEVPEDVRRETQATFDMLTKGLRETPFGRPVKFIDDRAVVESVKKLHGVYEELLASEASRQSAGEAGAGATATATPVIERKPGHPYFHPETHEAVVFIGLKGRTKTVHFDPQCADLAQAKERTLAENRDVEDDSKLKLCQNSCCKVPGKMERRNYEDVRARFKYEEGKSPILPGEYLS